MMPISNLTGLKRQESYYGEISRKIGEIKNKCNHEGMSGNYVRRVYDFLLEYFEEHARAESEQILYKWMIEENYLIKTVKNFIKELEDKLKAYIPDFVDILEHELKVVREEDEITSKKVMGDLKFTYKLNEKINVIKTEYGARFNKYKRQTKDAKAAIRNYKVANTIALLALVISGLAYFKK